MHSRSARTERNYPLRYLKAYLDKDVILRVGGRFGHAALCYDVNHPIIFLNNIVSPRFLSMSRIDHLCMLVQW